MVLDSPIQLLIWLVGALALGGLVKGVVGVGIPMVAVPLMSLVIPAHHAAALVLLPVIPANIVQMQAGGSLRGKVIRFAPLVIGISVGTVAGGWWFTRGDPRAIQFVIGVIVAGFVVVRLTSPNLAIPPRLERSLGLGVGVVAGVLGGMAMLIGPMVVMYMTSLGLDREKFVGGIAYVYFVTTLIIAATLAGYAQLDKALMVISALSCIPVFAGLWLGTKIRHLLSQAVFEKLLNVLLAGIACSLVLRALM